MSDYRAHLQVAFSQIASDTQQGSPQIMSPSATENRINFDMKIGSGITSDVTEPQH